MRPLLEQAVTIVVGAGLPISQVAIRRLGWPGAAAVATVSAGILAADLAHLAAARGEGTIRRIVRLEAVAAGVATVTGTLLLRDPAVQEARDEGWRVGRPELLRRLALGLMFGVLGARIRFEASAKADDAADGEGSDGYIRAYRHGEDATGAGARASR